MYRPTIWVIGFLCFLLCGIIIFFWLSKNKPATIFEQTSDQETSLPSNTTSSHYTDTPQVSNQVFREILPTDCTNECTAFEKLPDEYVYCQSVCGLSPADHSAPRTPINNHGIEQDIKQKNTAIQEGSLSDCETIKDAALRKACQFRITEDFLEE